MLRSLFSLLIIGLFVFSTACTDDPVSSGDNDVLTYQTANVKTSGRQYYDFDSNTASGTPSADFDLMFKTGTRVEEVGAPGSNEFFDVGSDPIVIAGTGISSARVDAADLSKVTAIPDAGEFYMDDTSKTAVIARNYLDPSYTILNDVYVIKNAEGNYGLLQVKNFVFNPAVFQITSLKIYFKFNGDGSTDFTSSTLDSMDTENGYDGKRYISFADGDLGMGYGLWDFEIEGSNIWLGPRASVLKLADTEISDVTTVAVTGYASDQLQIVATTSWYDTDDAHKVIPKDYVFVTKLVNGKYVAYEIVSYYDGEGNSGAFTIEWKTME